jgi:hypothetical protein
LPQPMAASSKTAAVASQHFPTFIYLAYLQLMLAWLLCGCWMYGDVGCYGLEHQLLASKKFMLRVQTSAEQPRKIVRSALSGCTLTQNSWLLSRIWL